MSKINNHNCGIHPIAKCAKPPQKKMQVKLKYRIYSIDEKGMLEEPKNDWTHTTYDHYDSIEEAVAAIIKNNDLAEYTILPITFSSDAN